jgi:hypothetical protein
MQYTVDRPLLRALAAVLAIAPFAFLFATPWGLDAGAVRIGIQQSALLGLAAAAGGCVLALGLRGHRAARAALVHPAVLAFLGFGALGATLAATHVYPGRTINGLSDTPHHHAGALFYFEIALLAAGYLTAARGPWGRGLAWMAVAAAAAAAIVTSGVLNFEGQPWLFVHFPQWYNFTATHLLPSPYRAWIAPVGILAAVALSGTGGRVQRYAAAAFLLWALWIGNNVTATIGVAAALLWLGAERVLPRLTSGRARAIFCLAALVLPLATVPFVAPFVERAHVRGVDAAGASTVDHIPSLDPRDHVVIQLLPMRTLWSRSWMSRVVWEDIFAHPLMLVNGRGWATFAESYARHWREVPGRNTREQDFLMSKTHWDAHSSARFHPHNSVLESTASLGLVGTIVIGGILLLPAVLPRRRQTGWAVLLACSLCTICSFWFLESSFAPFVAIAYATTVRPWRPGPRARRVALSAFALATVGCIAASIVTAVAGVRPPKAPECAGGNASEPAGFADYAKFLATGFSQEMPLLWFVQRLPEAQSLACTARFLGHSGGIDELSEMLRHRDTLLTEYADLPHPESVFPAEISQWEDDIVRLLDAAPGRTDVAVPYVSWIAAHQGSAEALALVMRFRPRIPVGDPVRSWLDACEAGLTGDAVAHRRLVTAAVEGGLANFVRIQHLNACVKMPAPPRRTAG